MARLGAVRGRVADACGRYGRRSADVTLIAATKGFPASDVAVLRSLGVVHVGESRDQEARAKQAWLRAAGPPGGDELVWHMIGQVQTNKARSVARWAALVHTVDRASLVDALDRAVRAAARPPLGVLVQLSLDPPGASGRAGVAESGLEELADRAASASGLVLRGLMLLAPRGAEPRAAFERAAGAAALLRAAHPAADIFSAGMSGDLEAAIAAGATHVRVGTALLGPRTTVV